MLTLKRNRAFTVDEYYRMAAAGILKPTDRVELLDGEIVEMAPIGSEHGGEVKRLNRVFASAVGRLAIVSVQDPIRLTDLSEPQPDIALLKPRKDFYKHSHPGPKDVLLVVEVAETSLATDRQKAVHYATAGIVEFWIVALKEDAIEVYRRPRAGGYREVRTFRRGQKLAPLAFPSKALAVEKLLA